MVLFLYGLSGAGKSTLANRIREKQMGRVIVLDGDEIRSGLNSDLGYSMEDRKENIRRICEIAKILDNGNFQVIVSVICPTEEMRKMAKSILENKVFMVYVSTPLEECINRDPKGLYAEKGEEMTGVGSEFEKPETFDFEIDTTNREVEDCVQELRQNFHLFKDGVTGPFFSRKPYYNFNSQSRWILNKKYNFAMPVIAKCASAQLGFWIMQDNRDYAKENSEQLPAAEGRKHNNTRDCKVEDIPEGYVKFAVYRDPIERFYSACRFPGYDANDVVEELKYYVDEDGVCRDQHMRRQSDFYKVEDVDYIVRLEDLNDFLNVMFNYNVEERPVKKHPVAVNTDLSLTEENMAFLKEYYAKDWEIEKSEKVWVNPNKKTETEETK